MTAGQNRFGHWCAGVQLEAVTFDCCLFEFALANALVRFDGYVARHAVKPFSRSIVSRLRPMKTSRELRSRVGQAPIGAPSINMWTPWKTKRSSSPLKSRIPLDRRMSGPRVCKSMAEPRLELLHVKRLLSDQ